MNMGNFDQPQMRRMAQPDSDQRLQRADGEMSGRPRRSPAALILGGIALVLVVVFIVLLATGGGDAEAPGPGAIPDAAPAPVVVHHAPG